MTSPARSPRAASRPTPFGSALRRWRGQRGLSQMALALEAEVSPRHLCFVENGRSRPSRELVLALAAALDLPLRETNDLLEQAGFAREFQECGLEGELVPEVRAAIDLLLTHHEPFPAIVIDRHWNLRRTNAGAQRFFAWLSQGRPTADANLLRALFDPERLRPFVANFPDVAATLLQRIRTEAVGGILDTTTRALVEQLSAFPGVPSRTAHRTAPTPLVPVVFQKGGRRLSFFSALTTLGTPRDVTLQELRLEHFFPADPATEAALRDGLG